MVISRLLKQVSRQGIPTGSAKRKKIGGFPNPRPPWHHPDHDRNGGSWSPAYQKATPTTFATKKTLICLIPSTPRDPPFRSQPVLNMANLKPSQSMSVPSSQAADPHFHVRSTSLSQVKVVGCGRLFLGVQSVVMLRSLRCAG